MLKKNQTYQVTIIDLNNLGFGVCKIDGISVFVADTVTGDEAEIRIIKTAKTYAVGTCVKLITPSTIRQSKEDACPVTRRCGGRVYQNVRYEHELELKQAYVTYAMKKAGAGHVKVLPTLSTKNPGGYRNKAQYPVGADKSGKPVIGFYAAKTHDIIPADRCALQPAVFSEIAAFLRGYMEQHGISAYDETTGRGLVRHLYLRTAAATGEIMVCFVINGTAKKKKKELTEELTRRFPAIVSVSTSENTKNTNVIMGNGVKLLWGKPYIEDILCGKRFRISPMSFYQVNHDGAELLYGTAKKLLDLKPGETLLDLYCGIGTIGLSLAEKDTPLIGIEIVPEAIENAKENAALNGMTNAKFFCGDASDARKILADEHLNADAVVLDPPRKGLTPEVTDYLGSLSPKRIVYISCDADTLARDITRFETVGYHTDTAQPVDMFSRTGHVETVCLLSKE
ncbi:MAG: 23S rRNA (uracil(1939)-C(5))-methyltransferase RlmD [Clostridia bacterium]|nr:23S rRNA (uracil(1939)-C(5))-methyltransferase RlmD [Clostridia bacterium]